MKYITNRRINVRTVRNIKNNEGLTLRNGKIVEYKTGWQVGITGIEVKTASFPHPAQRNGSQGQHRHLVQRRRLLHRHQQANHHQARRTEGRQDYESAEHLRMETPQGWSACMVQIIKTGEEIPRKIL